MHKQWSSKKALKDGLDLDSFLKPARAIERAEHQAKKIADNNEVATNRVGTDRGLRNKFRRSQKQKHGHGQRSHSKDNKHKLPHPRKKNAQCYKCGGIFPHQGGPCPALEMKCHICQNIGHYSKMRRNEDKDVKAVDAHDTQSEDYYYTVLCITIGHVTQHKYAMINCKDIGFPCIINTGAGVNMMSETTYIQLAKPDLSPPGKTLFPYGPEDRKKSLPVIGKSEDPVLM